MPKKRGHGDGALSYIKGKKTWRGAYDVGFWPDGRRRQKFVTDKDKEKARAKLNNLIKEVKETGVALDRNATVTVWSDRWLNEICKPSMTPNGLAAYESVTRVWIVPQIGKRRVAELKPSDVRVVLKAISDADRSSATARKAYNILSLMLEAARLEGLTARNVAADVAPPEVNAKERGSLTTAQAIAILSEAASPRNVHGSLWWVALLGGLRQSERLGAQIASLDIVNNTYTVQWTLDEVTSEHGCERTNDGWSCGYKVGGRCPQRKFKLPTGYKGIHLSGRLWLGPPKSGRSRVVPLIPEVTEALRRYIVARASIPNPYGLIWRHDDGTPFLPHQEEQMWRNMLHSVGIITEKQLAPGSDIQTGHWARHTTATVLMELGVDAKIVGEIVGHQSERTTRGYQHVSSPAARHAMELLGQHMADGLKALDA